MCFCQSLGADMWSCGSPECDRQLENRVHNTQTHSDMWHYLCGNVRLWGGIEIMIQWGYTDTNNGPDWCVVVPDRDAMHNMMERGYYVPGIGIPFKRILLSKYLADAEREFKLRRPKE